MCRDFYPRSPCGERRTKKLSIPVPAYFYPRSPCGERQSSGNSCTQALPISIHALLAESDHIHAPSRNLYLHFYPRSPCGERRPRQVVIIIVDNFYPRSPCGERHISARRGASESIISIHALLAESDMLLRDSTGRSVISIHALLAESDARRASRQQPAGISIHALLAESDVLVLRKITITVDISIHALLAESDLTIMLYDASALIFLSTLSLRRATVEEVSGDTWARDFYPRSPCGERRC